MQKIKNGKKRAFSLTIILAMLLTMIPAQAFAWGTQPEDSHGVDMEWYNLRNNQENNGVTESPTPTDDQTASLKWGVKYGTGWGAAPTPPLILNSKIYIAQGNKIHELNKETGALIRSSDAMIGNVGYAMNPIIYADGMLYVQMSNGIIQAVDFETLKCVWHSEKLGGQTVSPISYTTVDGKGYVYTGTWSGENRDGVFFAVSTDIDEGKISDGDGKGGFEKAVTWQFQPSGSSIDKNPDIKYDPDLHATLEQEGNVAKRGFYWAGAYACENYIAVGSDDGTREGDYTANGVFYTLDPETGDIIDKYSGIKGDIRTSVTYDNGRLYFCTKGGKVCRIDVDEDGYLSNYTELQLVDDKNGGKNRMITSTPLVYGGKIYIGASGAGGQFDPDGGHVFAVIDDTSEELELMYDIPIAGYPQAAALLSTAYEGVDYDGKDGADGRVYIYFTYNSNPGGIYYIYDTPDATEPLTSGKELFVPESSMRQYCISTICADRDGTLYYKNDSCYVMAVETNNAYAEDIKITADDGTEATWNTAFDQKNTEYEVKVPAAASSITLNLTLPDDATAEVNGTAYTDGMRVELTGESTSLEVAVKVGEQTKTYTIEVKKISTDSTLNSLKVSTSNIPGSNELEISPEFNSDVTNYTAEATDVSYSLFWRVWVDATVEDSTIEVIPVENVEKVNDSTISSRGYVGVYAEDGNKTCKVQIKVTSEDGSSSTTYDLTILKKVKATGITIDQKDFTMDVTDDPVVLSATVTPEDATDKTVKWYSLNAEESQEESPVTIEEDGDGTLTPVSEGKATVTAISNSSTGLSAKITVTVTDKAKDVKDKVDALGEITLDSKADIDAAKAAYDALSDKQKERADTMGVKTSLEAAQDKYDELKEQADKDAADKAAADAVSAKIDAIGDVEDITLGSKTAIDDARAAYEGLTEEQKTLVDKDKLKALENAEKKLTELELTKAKEDAKADISSYKNMDDYRDQQKQELADIIADAGEAIDKADDKEAIEEIITSAKDEMDKVKTDDQLTEEEEQAAKAEADKKAAEEVDALIDAVGSLDDITLDSIEAINKATDAYNKLTDDQKRLVQGLDKLNAVVDKYESLKADSDKNGDNTDNTAKGEDASQGAVKTADESGILSWVILLGAAVLGFFGFRRKYNAGK